MQRKICTRKSDEFGRIILPVEARTALGIQENRQFDIFVEDGMILLKPNHDVPCCCICGESERPLKEVGHTFLCGNCMAAITLQL